jgi:hypothetical protein
MTFPPDYARIAQLIEAGQAREARLALVSILYRNSQDAQAWWYYAQVAENDKQLYHILRALLDLPTNAFTARARLALAKLAYQPQEGQTNQPKTAPSQVSPQVTHKASTRRYPVNPIAVLFALVALVIAVFGISALGVATAGNSTTASASVQGVLSTQESLPVVQIVTLPPVASATPYPTMTPYPTRTPRPPATALPPVITATLVYPKVTDVLPELNQVLTKNAAALYKAADIVNNAIGTTDKVSLEGVQAAMAQVDPIRKSRNTITWTNLNQVAPTTRQEVVLPAHVAFTDYANSLLQWIDLGVQTYQSYSSVGQTTGLATPVDASAVRQQWLAQNDLMKKQADVVKVKREVLQNALVNYTVFVEQALLATQVSGRAETVTSTAKRSIHLAAGKYQIVYRLETFGTSKGTLRISATNGAVPDVTLIDNAAQPTPGSQVLDFAEGNYEIQAEAVAWWVVAFEPSN